LGKETFERRGSNREEDGRGEKGRKENLTLLSIPEEGKRGKTGGKETMRGRITIFWGASPPAGEKKGKRGPAR